MGSVSWSTTSLATWRTLGAVFAHRGLWGDWYVCFFAVEGYTGSFWESLVVGEMFGENIAEHQFQYQFSHTFATFRRCAIGFCPHVLQHRNTLTMRYRYIRGASPSQVHYVFFNTIATISVFKVRSSMFHFCNTNLLWTLSFGASFWNV